jgi:hypothetical protein
MSLPDWLNGSPSLSHSFKHRPRNCREQSHSQGLVVHCRPSYDSGQRNYQSLEAEC